MGHKGPPGTSALPGPLERDLPGHGTVARRYCGEEGRSPSARRERGLERPEIAATTWRANVRWTGAFRSEATVCGFAPLACAEPTTVVRARQHVANLDPPVLPGELARGHRADDLPAVLHHPAKARGPRIG